MNILLSKAKTYQSIYALNYAKCFLKGQNKLYLLFVYLFKKHPEKMFSGDVQKSMLETCLTLHFGMTTSTCVED